MEDGNARQPFSMFFRCAAEAGNCEARLMGLNSMANVITAKMENLFCEHLEQDAPLCLFLLSDGKGYSKTGGFVRTQQYQYDKNLYNLFGR